MPRLRDLGGSHIRDRQGGRRDRGEGRTPGPLKGWLLKTRGQRVAGAPRSTHLLWAWAIPGFHSFTPAPSHHPVPSPLPPLNSESGEKEARGECTKGHLRPPHLHPSPFLGDLCRTVQGSRPGSLHPTPTWAVSTPSFCVGNENSHCRRKKSICFRFVRLREVDRRSEVQMLPARAMARVAGCGVPRPWFSSPETWVGGGIRLGALVGAPRPRGPGGGGRAVGAARDRLGEPALHPGP